MNYELCKKLKEARFPFHGIVEGKEAWDGKVFIDTDLCAYALPTLSELIEACGNNFQSLKHIVKNITVGISGTGESFWRATGGIDFADIERDSATPEEAVANLWLALQDKK